MLSANNPKSDRSLFEGNLGYNLGSSHCSLVYIRFPKGSRFLFCISGLSVRSFQKQWNLICFQYLANSVAPQLQENFINPTRRLSCLYKQQLLQLIFDSTFLLHKHHGDLTSALCSRNSSWERQQHCYEWRRTGTFVTHPQRKAHSRWQHRAEPSAKQWSQWPSQLECAQEALVSFHNCSHCLPSRLWKFYGRNHKSCSAFVTTPHCRSFCMQVLTICRTWNLPENVINEALVGNLFMLGAGGIFVVALSAYFGRLPVLFWFSIFAFLTAAWSAAAKSFHSFMAARILHGFFSTVAQAGGLMFIKDIFFFHEHP